MLYASGLCSIHSREAFITHLALVLGNSLALVPALDDSLLWTPRPVKPQGSSEGMAT